MDDDGGSGLGALNERDASAGSWAERAADRSPAVQRSRARSESQARIIVSGARTLVAAKGTDFTTQELCKTVGVALRTFYRYFAGKDRLLLAVIEAMVAEHCLDHEERSTQVSDPLARLRALVIRAISTVDSEDGEPAGPSFVTSGHWRLHRLYPEELAQAIKPFNDLLRRELQAAVDAGQLTPPNPDFDAWLVSQLTMAIYHHYAFAPTDLSGAEIGERVWAFCRAGLGGGMKEPTGAGVTRQDPRS